MRSGQRGVSEFLSDRKWDVVDCVALSRRRRPVCVLLSSFDGLSSSYAILGLFSLVRGYRQRGYDFSQHVEIDALIIIRIIINQESVNQESRLLGAQK